MPITIGKVLRCSTGRGAVARTVVLALATTVCFGGPVLAQTGGFPTISARGYTAGSATVTVTGSAKIAEEIPLNTQASISDGEVTWLQFGDSGSEKPNALITYGQTKEIGVSVGKGKLGATGGIMPGEPSQCAGKVKVTETEVTGEYKCLGLTSYEPGVGMGKVDVTVRFTAKS
jgi:hypothetical protein